MNETDRIPEPEQPAATAAISPHVNLTPRERLLPYEDLLRAAGWRVSFRADDRRACLEGFHPSGAAVMATAVRDRDGVRRRNHFYVLHARAQGPSIWLGVRKPGLEHFATHRTLPPEARYGYVSSKCPCDKKHFPLEERAEQVLRQIQARQNEEREAHLLRRVYRCPADDRTWHLTKKPTWHGPQPQDLWASAATATPRKAPPHE